MSHTINYTKLVSKLNNQPELYPYKVNIKSVDSFLTVRETLTRIGRLQKNDNGKESLWQVCHIVQDENTNEYYVVHFKHLYILSGKESTTELNEQDLDQLTYITHLLSIWNLCSPDEVINPETVNHRCNISAISYQAKKNVLLRKKFFIKGE